MRPYHATSAENAKGIIAKDFQNRPDCAIAERAGPGVWLSDEILTVMSGAKGDTVFEVILPDDIDLTDYDWTMIEDDGSPCAYQEWCDPASLVNTHAKVRLLSGDERDEIELPQGLAIQRERERRKATN